MGNARENQIYVDVVPTTKPNKSDHSIDEQLDDVVSRLRTLAFTQFTSSASYNGNDYGGSELG